MSILIKPLVTEKISALNEKGKYGFVVKDSANKVEIKQAVEKMYGVNVEHVNTINVLGSICGVKAFPLGFMGCSLGVFYTRR